ncbi:MAG: hypothetical protein JKX78_00095 [Alteromonadaceae bacterium]|nr:hypothetical protein [Alteromonadaceae bacterium]
MPNRKYGIIILFLLIASNVQAQEVPLSQSTSKTATSTTSSANSNQKKTVVIEKKPIETITIEYKDDWSNDFHDSLADSVYQSAVWFDSFFTLDLNEQKHPKTSAKIRFGWLPRRNDYAVFKTRFRIKVSLPYLKDRTDIILSDDSEDGLANLPLETLNRTQSFSQDSFSAALRYVNNRQENKFTDTRIGISSGDIFIRYRHRRFFSWQSTHGFKIEPAVYYFIQDGLGARLLLEYNFQATTMDQFRLNYSIRASESFKGEKWKYGLYHLRQLDNKRAALIGLVAQGRYASSNGNFTEKYNLSYRYRFNALRSWLYFEVEPFIEWAKEDGFSTNPGIALRVEGFFEKN